MKNGSPGTGLGEEYNRYEDRVLAVAPHGTAGVVQETVDTITKSINNFNKQKKQKLTAAGITPVPELLSSEIAGYRVCSSCHEKQYLFWKTTAHSSSYATLQQQGQAYNLSCLVCHVTGGDILPSSPEDVLEHLLFLSDARLTVGCESCHGASGAHALSPLEHLPQHINTESACTICHTPARDKSFVYSEKLVQVACPSD